LQLVLFGVVPYLLLGHLHLVQSALHMLDMMTYLMRKHVGLSEVPFGSMFMLEVIEEAKVNIDLLILWTIKRPHARTRGAACADGGAAIEHQHRGRIAMPGLGEDFRPDRLRICEHRLDKGRLLIILCRVNQAAAAAARKRGQIDETAKIRDCANAQDGNAKFGSQ